MTNFHAPELDLAPYSPYFSLTNSWYLSKDRKELGEPPLPEYHKPPQAKQKPEKYTVQEVFGPWKEMSDDDQAQFLLLLMKEVEVDWKVACSAAAKARKIGGVSQMRARLAKIVRKHNFALEDGKKIIGGPILNKSLLATLKTDASCSKMPRNAPEMQAKTPKGPRKRKRDDAGLELLATKKSKATVATPNKQGTTNTSIPGYTPAQQAERNEEGGLMTRLLG